MAPVIIPLSHAARLLCKDVMHHAQQGAPVAPRECEAQGLPGRGWARRFAASDAAIMPTRARLQTHHLNGAADGFTRQGWVRWGCQRCHPAAVQWARPPVAPRLQVPAPALRAGRRRVSCGLPPPHGRIYCSSALSQSRPRSVAGRLCSFCAVGCPRCSVQCEACQYGLRGLDRACRGAQQGAPPGPGPPPPPPPPPPLPPPRGLPPLAPPSLQAAPAAQPRQLHVKPITKTVAGQQPEDELYRLAAAAACANKDLPPGAPPPLCEGRRIKVRACSGCWATSAPGLLGVVSGRIGGWAATTTQNPPRHATHARARAGGARAAPGRRPALPPVHRRGAAALHLPGRLCRAVPDRLRAPGGCCCVARRVWQTSSACARPSTRLPRPIHNRAAIVCCTRCATTTARCLWPRRGWSWRAPTARPPLVGAAPRRWLGHALAAAVHTCACCPSAAAHPCPPAPAAPAQAPGRWRRSTRRWW